MKIRYWTLGQRKWNKSSEDWAGESLALAIKARIIIKMPPFYSSQKLSSLTFCVCALWAVMDEFEYISLLKTMILTIKHEFMYLKDSIIWSSVEPCLAKPYHYATVRGHD